MKRKGLGRFLVFDRDFTPPNDPVFQYLMQQAYHGSIPVYGAVVTPHRFRRFDDAFHPERGRKGAAALASIMARWNAGDAPQMWVYPDENDLVVADDYFTLAAIEQGRPRSVAVQILGTPYGDGVLNTVGPFETEQVKAAIRGAAIL